MQIATFGDFEVWLWRPFEHIFIHLLIPLTFHDVCLWTQDTSHASHLILIERPDSCLIFPSRDKQAHLLGSCFELNAMQINPHLLCTDPRTCILQRWQQILPDGSSQARRTWRVSSHSHVHHTGEDWIQSQYTLTLLQCIATKNQSTALILTGWMLCEYHS